MGKLFDEFHQDQVFETPRRTITEADVVAFAGMSGDYNPVHTDEIFAQQTQFGARIAHGPMMIGMAFGLASRLDLIDGTVIALLSVNWDFHAPVRLGDTMHAVIRVTEKRDTGKPDRGLLGLEFKMRNQHGEDAQTGRARLLMRRKAVGDA